MLLESIRKLGIFNIFVGAGISKLSPAYAPVWKEMLIDFCQALFTKMRDEKWPGVEGSEADVAELQRFDFRPETFWERILLQTSLSFVSDALRVVNLGLPNLNHRAVAEMVARGMVANVVTTNFDEYLDITLAKHVDRVVNSCDFEGTSSVKRPLYFKPHGTVSDSQSIQFTLAHTKKLPDWKARFLNAVLTNRPLLITGYSGYDDDLMPCLFEIAATLPEVIVVCYPGSNPSEPIRGLGCLANVSIIEADISHELRVWIVQEIQSGHSVPDLLVDPPMTAPSPLNHHLHSLNLLPIPMIPFVVSSLFELAANRTLAGKYAWLAEDASNDGRYMAAVPIKLRRQIRLHLASLEAGGGNQQLSYTLAKLASQFDDSESPVAETTLDNINRVFEYFQNPFLSEELERQIEMHALGALQMVDRGVISGSIITFRAAWCMGRLRRRQNRLPEAIEFYERAGSPPEILDDIQLSCFLLDFGSALLVYSLIDKDNNALTNSVRLLAISERIALRTQDHLTAAQAKINLSQAYYFCGEGDVAMGKAREAREHASLTGNNGLQCRADKLMMELERRLASR